MVWEIFKGSEEKWKENYLNSLVHYRQSYDWGTYKSLMNWKVLRLIKYNKENEETFLQLTYKKFFFISAIYIPGNINGDINFLDKDFFKKIKEFTNSTFIYVRYDSNSTKLSDEENILFNNGWRRPLHREHASKSVEIDINQDIDSIVSNCSRDWLKSYKRSIKKFNEENFHIKFTNNPNVNDLMLISSIMTNKKKIYNSHSIEEFKFLNTAIPDNTLFGVVYDNHGKPIAYRGMIFFKNKSWDLSVASTEEGRKSFSGYFLMIEMIKKAKSLGVEIYNLGGTDEIKKPGVYHFKKGIATSEFRYSGEWEYSNLKFARYIINLLIILLLSDKIRRVIPLINKISF